MTADIETLLDSLRSEIGDFKNKNITLSYMQVDMLLEHVDRLQDGLQSCQRDSDAWKQKYNACK